MGKQAPESSARKDVQSHLCLFMRIPIFKLSNRWRKTDALYTIDFGHEFNKIFDVAVNIFFRSEYSMEKTMKIVEFLSEIKRATACIAMQCQCSP